MENKGASSENSRQNAMKKKMKKKAIVIFWGATTFLRRGRGRKHHLPEHERKGEGRKMKTTKATKKGEIKTKYENRFWARTECNRPDGLRKSLRPAKRAGSDGGFSALAEATGGYFPWV